MQRFIPLWAVPLILLFSIGTIWIRLAAVRATYAVTKTERLVAQVRDEREKAELRLAHFRSPKRLENLAKSRFHLSAARPEQVVRLRQ